MAKKRVASARTAARARPKTAAPVGARMAAPASAKIMEYLEAIKQSRSTICDARERVYRRALDLAQRNAGPPEDVDKTSVDWEAARIDLANAEIDILKAQAGEGPQ